MVTDMDVNLMTWLDVDEKEDLNVFQVSAKTVILKESLVEQLAKLNRKINRHFISDDEYFSEQVKRNLVVRDSGFYGPLVMGTLVAMGMLSNVLGWTPILFILCIGVMIAIIVIVKKRDLSNAKIEAGRALIAYQTEREMYSRNISDWKKEREGTQASITKCAALLKALSKLPEGIPEKYWDDAPLLWSYVEDRRADNLKEALHVLHEDRQRAEILGTMQGLADQNNALLSTVHDLSNQLDSIEASVAQAELNNDLNTLLTIAAVYDSNN